MYKTKFTYHIFNIKPKLTPRMLRYLYAFTYHVVNIKRKLGRVYLFNIPIFTYHAVNIKQKNIFDERFTYHVVNIKLFILSKPLFILLNIYILRS